MTIQSTVSVALMVLPFGGAVLALLFDKRPNVRETATLLVAASLLVVVASLLPEVLAGDRPAVSLFGEFRYALIFNDADDTEYTVTRVGVLVGL